MDTARQRAHIRSSKFLLLASLAVLAALAAAEPDNDDDDDDDDGVDTPIVYLQAHAAVTRQGHAIAPVLRAAPAQEFIVPAVARDGEASADGGDAVSARRLAGIRDALWSGLGRAARLGWHDRPVDAAFLRAAND